MLLTKLIPPKSRQLKEAVSVFNRFLEEPHTTLNEKLELLIAGGRGCGKSTIASGMMIKACGESKANGICLCKSSDSQRWVIEQLVWSLRQLDVANEKSLPTHSFTLTESKSKISVRGIDIGMQELYAKTVSMPQKRFVWIDAAEELEREREYLDVLENLQLRENPIVILTYNPKPDKDHWLNLYSDEILRHNGSGNRWVFKPMYLDMEKDMLGEEFFRRAEQVRITNPMEYVHEYLGIPTEG